MLEMDGLVDNMPQRGFYIHRVSLREMIDLFMLRQALEMVAAYSAAEVATAEDIDVMVSIFASFSENGPEMDVAAYREADRRFHDVLIGLCRNRLVSKINGTMGIMGKTYMGGLLRSPLETLPEHLALIGAIRRRSPKEAQLLAMEHLEVTRKRMQAVHEQLTGMGIDTSTLPISEAGMETK